MRLKNLGEFGLIRRIIKAVTKGKKNDPGLIVGPGDDAFVARFSRGNLVAATKDILIENVHFKRKWSTPWQIGWKSIAVNLSDLAAMGGCKPLYCLVGLGLTVDIPVDFVDKLYTGMNNISKKHGLLIVGGDTVLSKKDIIISITLLGELKKEYLVTRHGAEPGDLVFVTGTFGDSAGGLFLLSKGIKKGPAYVNYLIKKHLLPEPRLEQASKLARTRKITSMIDSSDGFGASIRFITESSKAGARIDIEKIPVSKQLTELSEKHKKVDVAKFVLNGGEEYELMFTAKPEDFPLLRSILPNIKAVGNIVPGKGIKYFYNGRPQKTGASGYEHFKS